MHVHRACSEVAECRDFQHDGISVVMPPPWRVLEWVAFLAMSPGRVMVGEMGSLSKVPCAHMIGGVAMLLCKAQSLIQSRRLTLQLTMCMQGTGGRLQAVLWQPARMDQELHRGKEAKMWR